MYSTQNPSPQRCGTVTCPLCPHGQCACFRCSIPPCSIPLDISRCLGGDISTGTYCQNPVVHPNLFCGMPNCPENNRTGVLASGVAGQTSFSSHHSAPSYTCGLVGCAICPHGRCTCFPCSIASCMSRCMGIDVMTRFGCQHFVVNPNLFCGRLDCPGNNWTNVPSAASGFFQGSPMNVGSPRPTVFLNVGSPPPTILFNVVAPSAPTPVTSLPQGSPPRPTVASSAVGQVLPDSPIPKCAKEKCDFYAAFGSDYCELHIPRLKCCQAKYRDRLCKRKTSQTYCEHHKPDNSRLGQHCFICGTRRRDQEYSSENYYICHFCTNETIVLRQCTICPNTWSNEFRRDGGQCAICVQRKKRQLLKKSK